MWILALNLESGGGCGLPQPLTLGGVGVGSGVGVGVGAGVGVAPGAGVGVAPGFGVGVVEIVGMLSLTTPEAGAFGDALGVVGSSSVIVCHPDSAKTAPARIQAFRFIAAPYLEFASEDHT